MQKLIFTIGMLFLFVGPCLADGKQDPCHYSTEGTDFWFGIMQNRNSGATHVVEITVTSRVGAQFTVAWGPTETPIGSTYTVAPNSSVRVPIDYSLLESKGSETVENKGIHLVSTNPVNVYALNYRTQSSDVAVIYPAESLGLEYFAMCYSPRYTSNNESNSEFLIVASQDNTTVNVTPTRTTDQGKPAGIPVVVKLNKGQSYQVQSSNTDATGKEDLTGSYAVADKPIAFFSGSKATTIPFSGYTNYSYDHLYEQLPPTSTWGKEFYVVPLQLRTKDTYRILAAENGTTVKIEGTNTTKSLNRGEFYEFELTIKQACRIVSNRKILLAQYCRSQRADESAGVGDPFMIIISPVVQKMNDVTFEAYESEKIKNIFYVNIITLSTEVGNITLDGKSISSYFSSFPNGVYSYAQVPIVKGTHRLWNTNETGGFLAFIYGFGNSGSTESYGYGVGFNLNIQLDLGFSNVSNDTLILCRGTEEKLDAGGYFERYLWSTGDTTSYIMASKEGWYDITATTGRDCKKSARLYLKVSDPRIDLGKVTSSCGPGKVILDAGKQVKTYQWQDGSTDRTFTVNKTGDYSVSGTNEFGCKASDTIHVDVFDEPKVKITGDTLHCDVFTSELHVDITNVDSLLWNYPGTAQWSCNSADLEFQNRKPDGVTLKANKPGLYKVNYILTTKDGCSDSDFFEVGFYEIPESDFQVYSPESTDKCSSYERIVKYTGKSGPTAKFNWDFGGLIVLETIAPNHFKISIGANKPNRTISLVVQEHGCTSPVFSQTIGVKPTFSFEVDKIHGCDALCVQFGSKVTIMDDVSFLWTFGDGSESNLQNPAHCYRDTGKYDVSLMITNLIDGCRNGSVEKQMIQIFPTPKAVLSADAEICYEDTLRVEYLRAKPNSHARWSAKGNQLLMDENTRATYLLTNETSEVGFTVEEDGCTSEPFKVQVKRKPNFDFEVSETDICQPFPVTLKSKTSDPGLQFFWTVDVLKRVPGDSLVHLFTKEGYYSVVLEAVSSLTGCSDTVTKEQFIHVYPLPVPEFAQNYQVATIEHPDISFTNESDGAVRYVWDFGDGTGSEEHHPQHTYTAIGEYRVLLKAYTDFGCTDTISSGVKIIPFTFYVPNAFRPDSDIAENQVFLPLSFREGVDPGKYALEVFNRVGSKVYETRNPDSGWNGKSPNGTTYEPGIYVWVLEFTDIQGYNHLQKGTVMLVR